MSARIVIRVEGPDRDGLFTARVGDDAVAHRYNTRKKCGSERAVRAVVEQLVDDIARLAINQGSVTITVERAKEKRT